MGNVIIEGFKTSLKAANEISKENLQAEIAASKARHEEAIAPDSGMAEYKAAKGIKGKAKAAINGMKANTERVKKAERQMRYDAVHLTGTKETLKTQRENREAMLNRNPYRAVKQGE